MLGFGKSAPDRDSRVLIVEDRGEYVGLLVDWVGEVYEVNRENDEPIPTNIPVARSRYFTGIQILGEQVVTLVNPGMLVAENRQ